MCVSPLVHGMIYYFYLATVPRLDYHQGGGVEGGDGERCPDRGGIILPDETPNWRLNLFSPNAAAETSIPTIFSTPTNLYPSLGWVKKIILYLPKTHKNRERNSSEPLAIYRATPSTNS